MWVKKKVLSDFLVLFIYNTRFAQMDALWSIYELILSYMIRSYMYPGECMYLQKGKIIRWLWSIKSAITQNGTKQEIQSLGLEINLRTENNRTEQENNKTMFPNEEGQDEWGT